MAARESKDTLITVFVSTCQIPIFDSTHEDATATSAASTAFRATKFPTRVPATARLAELQQFLRSQWAIAKSPFARVGVDEHFFTFRGRLLRLDGALDAYCAFRQGSSWVESLGGSTSQLTCHIFTDADIMDNDTIYLRFSSMGKVLDPWAMSTSELRAELKARNSYESKMQPEQLMLRLQELVMKESRLQRLQQATRKEETGQVVAITKELANFQAKLQSESKKRDVLFPSESEAFTRPKSLKWPHPPCPNRTVFLSITELERTYQVVPRDVLDPALFIFDTERRWVFSAHNELQKQSFDYKYMCFETDFLEMLTLKEEAGMVFWFRPQKSYEKLSAFIASFDDPVTKRKFSPLVLKEAKWLTLAGINGWEGKVRQDGRKRDASKFPQFTKSIARVLTNIQSQSFDYLAVQEILFQSNPTLMFAPLL
ncbi:hypothetical protein PybrP1_009824 [[Pythium] brassicae (nom. inval.)]|nr:hypothetical protein PybrP1_009824 [[Pythium] brassicae (nom. inval.)]